MSRVLLEFNGMRVDLKDLDQRKVTVYYNSYEQNSVKIDCGVNAFNSIVFENVEDAEASIKTHEKEWKIYLGVED